MNHQEHTVALADVIAERHRQIEQEGWTPAHDDEHTDASLAVAGACYALIAASVLQPRGDYSHRFYNRSATKLWPWDVDWWKPKDPRRDLVRAAALIVAEIERLDRATEPDKKP